MKKVIVTFVLLTLFIAVNAFSQAAHTPTYFVVPVEMARTATFQEAPVVDAEGNVYVSEPIGGPVTRVTPDGEASVWFDSKGSNGHLILGDGTHVLCDHDRNVILRLDANGKEIGEPITTCGGEPLKGPNDMVLDSHGGFYFTDPRPPMGRVGYVDSSGESHLVLEYASEIGYPNGIALRADGKVLYVADTPRHAIYSFEVKSPGKVGPEKLFAKLFKREDGKITYVDGIVADDKGNLYVPNLGQVLIFNSQGELVHWIPVGDIGISIICFGGPEKHQLYITAGVQDKNDPEKTTGILYKLEKVKITR